MAQLLPWEESELQTEAANAVVHVSRTYRAPREKVYAAWTDPELLTQWFRPVDGASRAELDVRPGGGYRIRMDPRGQLPGPADIVGTYLEVDPPERLVFTFAWELPPTEELDGPVDHPDPARLQRGIDGLRKLDSLVTVQFREREGETEVTVTHERVPTQDLRAFHIFGWRMVLFALEVLWRE